MSFDETINRQNSESFKWQTYAEDVLPMWVADMDFLSPPGVINALVERCQHGIFGYPRGLTDDSEQLPALRQIICERMWQRYAWKVEFEDLVFIPGVVTAFNLASHAFAVPDGGLLVQTPVYAPILNAAKTTGAVPQETELIWDGANRYEIDFTDFEASITPQTRMFLLSNPHNPVGRVFTRYELTRLADISLRNGLIICADEIHSDLVFSGHEHIPIASIDPEIGQSTITLIAPSKTFNLAGLQFSVAIIQNAELKTRYLAARKGLVPWVNLMGLIAAQEAYQCGEEWLDQLITYLAQNRDYLVNFLQENIPQIKMPVPEGTYLAWLDCREAVIPSNPYEFFLQYARVALNKGTTFGKGGEGFVRLNFGCPRSTLVEGLNRISEALRNIG